jgi:neutral ceramidase
MNSFFSKKHLSLAVISLTLVGCGAGSSSSNQVVSKPIKLVDVTTPASIAIINRASIANPEMAACVLNSSALSVTPSIPDVSGRLEIDVAVGSQLAGDCQNNKDFRFGSGLYDITGVVANTNGMGWEAPNQVFSGVHTRQYARAFSIESPCNGKRVLFISTDTGMVFGAVRQKVLAEIATDSKLSAHYGPENVMLSATHTHQGPGGYSHYEATNLFHFGYDPLTFQTITSGILQAIRIAHANIEEHPETAPISLAIGELLNANINRSPPAFKLNSAAERFAFSDNNGEPIDNNKRFVQLNMVRDNASAVGVINWFGVHPTILGSDLSLVSGDHKGFASLGLERIMNTQYGLNGALNFEGKKDNFVAAFAQTDEGDSSPNIFIAERPFPDPTRGGGVDSYDSNRIAGTKQIAKSLELFIDDDVENSLLSGGVDFRLMRVSFDQVEITDPVILTSLNHPDAMDVDVKKTCTSVLGVSFGAGAEDGPAAGAEGVSCSDSPDVIASAQQDFIDASAGKIPANMIAAATLCNVDEVPDVANMACHAEKPVFLIVGSPLNFEASILPIQLFRIGDLAIVGLPWEVTTVAARRIRKTILDTLAPQGVGTVVIAGLANDYAHYLTTREEYSSQQYEGASTVFGPWTLAAVQQETRKLAIAMRDGVSLTSGPDYVEGQMLFQRPAYIASDVPSANNTFGDLLIDVPATAIRGTKVFAEFQAGHPRNDLRTGATYASVEQQQGDGSFTVVAADYSPELRFVWKPEIPQEIAQDPVVVGSSTAEVQWMVPLNASVGVYRLRLEGAAQTTGGLVQPYSSVSSLFEIKGMAAECAL